MIFVGPLSGPMHGQLAATLALRRSLPPDIGTFDIGSRGVRKVVAYARAAVAILTHPQTTYISVASYRGIVLTIILAACARLRGAKAVIHHHSCARLMRYSASMAALARVAGPEALHLVQGDRMSAGLRSLYGAQRVSNLSNAASVTVQPSPTRSGPLTFGHMGVLMEAKGIGRAVAALRAVPAARLIVAGPCHDDFARNTVTAAQQDFGDRFAYLGPVSEGAKQRFFDAIDVFLFPSLYPVETQGIVNLEALAAGKPVIAYGMGCIPDDLSGSGSMVVPPDADFAEAVRCFVGTFARSPLPRRRFLELSLQSEKEQRAVLSELLHDGFVSAVQASA